jgi:hypothetical protein
VRLGRRSGGGVGPRQLGGRVEGVDERVLVQRVDEDARLARDELRGAADPRRHDRAP